MFKRIVRSILHRMSKPIYINTVKKILLIGSGNAEYIQPAIKQLKELYCKAEITLYPHSSCLADLPRFLDCQLIEFEGGKGVLGKLKFFRQLRKMDKDLVVSLWTGEPQYNRFKAMGFLLNCRCYVALNEHVNYFQVSPENLGLLRMHFHMRKGTTAGSITLARMLRKLLSLILIPLGVVILLIRVCGRLLARSGKRSEGTSYSSSRN